MDQIFSNLPTTFWGFMALVTAILGMVIWKLLEFLGKMSEHEKVMAETLRNHFQDDSKTLTVLIERLGAHEDHVKDAMTILRDIQKDVTGMTSR